MAVDGLEGLGAKVGDRDDQLGYVRATVPLDKVEQAFGLAGVAAADVDQTKGATAGHHQGVLRVMSGATEIAHAVVYALIK
jgi:hypothetical protein